MSAVVDEAVPVEEGMSSYDFLDYLEQDPAKRLIQVQQVRAHLLKTNGYIDKEASKLLKDMSQTDLGLMRLEVDKDNAQSFSEMSKAVSSLFKNASDPYKIIDVNPDPAKAPTLALEELGETPVEDWALSQELGSPEYSEIMPDD